jgi:hypothetical protein
MSRDVDCARIRFEPSIAHITHPQFSGCLLRGRKESTPTTRHTGTGSTCLQSIVDALRDELDVSPREIANVIGLSLAQVRAALSTEVPAPSGHVSRIVRTLADMLERAA